MAQPPDWPEIESSLTQLPHWAVSLFAGRSARRIYPCILSCEAQYGAEAIEWLAATDACLRMVEVFSSRKGISRFTLDLAAEIVRAAATATSEATRRQGPSAEAHQAELAYAAAAMAADSARTSLFARAVRCALEAARIATNGQAVSLAQLGDLQALLAGEPLPALWPTAELPQIEGVEKRLANHSSPLLSSK